jgi:autotransporter-associated beta strand protein
MLTLLGQQLFPANYPWNQSISNAPVAANSAAIIAHIGASIHVHPDWGADSPANGNDPLYGIPFNVVHGNSTASVNVIIDNYPGESDVVPVPIPANAVIEGDYQDGPNPNGGGYNAGQRGDSHLIVWDEDNYIAYELYGVTRPSDPTLFPNTDGVEHAHTDDMWHAAQETVWYMKTDQFRTLGYTSADAAGLSILAGLVRPDEGLTVAQGGQGAIDHALRMTLPAGDINPQYIYPASHMVDETQGSDNLPLGARLRLANNSTVDNLIDAMPPESQIIARAMQQYGLIVADIGSAMYVTGASGSVDANNNLDQTWDMNDIFASNGLKMLTAGDFQVVNLTPVVTGLSASSGPGGSTLYIYGQNFSGAAGYMTVNFGNIPVTPVNVLSDTEISVTVPTGLGTVDVTVQSGQNETDKVSDNPNANVNAPIFGYGTSATTSADKFTLTGPEVWGNGADTLNWTDAGNWSLDAVPNVNVDVIFASAGLSNGTTVNLNGSQAARSLTIESTASYTIGGSGSLALGAGAITRTAASSGTQTISEPVLLDANGVSNIAGSGQLVVSDTVSGAVSLQKTGAGTLLLSGNNTFNQGTIVTGGTLVAGSSGAILSGTTLMVGENVESYFGLPVAAVASVAAANRDDKHVAAVTPPEKITNPHAPIAICASIASRINPASPLPTAKGSPADMALLRAASGSDDLDQTREREMRLLALDALFADYGG